MEAKTDENPGDGPSACEQSWSWTSTARIEFANIICFQINTQTNAVPETHFRPEMFRKQKQVRQTVRLPTDMHVPEPWHRSLMLSQRSETDLFSWAENQRTQECSDKPAACSPLGREESNILWSFSESAKVTTGTVCHGSECQFGKRKLSVSPFFLNCSGDQVVLPNHKEIKPCS